MSARPQLSHQRFASACYAPFTSLHLDPRGLVRACCMNEWQHLGVIGEERLVDIWRGASLERLRDALAAGSFALGCERCELAVGGGAPETAYRVVFDDLVAESPRPEWPRQLELALSNTCNLQCTMCNGDLSSAIRSRREHRAPLVSPYDDAFFADLDLFLPHVERLTLLGGEPFLAREAMRVLDRLEQLDLTPSCHVTTNGTQWSERIRQHLARLPMHVAVSLDALSEATATAVRVGVDHELVLANIDRFRADATGPGQGVSLAFALMVPNWHELGAVLAWADGRDLDVYVNDVSYPTRFALAFLTLDRLEEVVAALDEEDRTTGRALGRNRAVWERELRKLRRTLDERRRQGDPAGTAVALGSRDLLERHVARIDGEWDATWVETDPAQVVASVRAEGPSGVRLGLPLLVGRPFREAVEVMRTAVGPVVDSRIVSRAVGIEDRTATLEGADGPVTVRLAMSSDEDGRQRWWIATRRG